jgi:hypothetical protein
MNARVRMVQIVSVLAKLYGLLSFVQRTSQLLAHLPLTSLLRLPEFSRVWAER